MLHDSENNSLIATVADTTLRLVFAILFLVINGYLGTTIFFPIRASTTNLDPSKSTSTIYLDFGLRIDAQKCIFRRDDLYMQYTVVVDPIKTLKSELSHCFLSAFGQSWRRFIWETS